MLDPFVRCYGLVQRGDPGLACDDDGLALGTMTLAKTVRDATGHQHCRLRPRDELAQALQLAYGPVADPVVERWCRGLAKVADSIATGQDAYARIYAALLGFPEITPAGMTKLARATTVQKYNPDWDTESRVPPKNPGGGEWTSGGEIEIAARGDLPCQGCSSGGSYGTTGMFSIEGKILCHECAVKAAGVESEPASVKAETLRPYILGPK